MILLWRRSPLRRARRAARTRDWPRAAAAYRRHLARFPGDARAWMQLGHCLKEQGDLPAATAAYREAVRIAPAVADSWIHLAFLERGNGAAAIAALEQAIAADSGSTAAIAATIALGARDRLPTAVQWRIEAEEGVYARIRYAAWRKRQAADGEHVGAVPSVVLPSGDGLARRESSRVLAESPPRGLRPMDDWPGGDMPSAGPTNCALSCDAPPDMLAVIDGRGVPAGLITLTRATLGDVTCLILTDDPSTGDAAAGHQATGHAGADAPLADRSATGSDYVAAAGANAFPADAVLDVPVGGYDAVMAAHVVAGNSAAATMVIGGDIPTAGGHLLLVEAGTRLASDTVATLRMAVAETGAGAAYADHDHWATVEGGIVYSDPCFQPMFDPLWFARAAVRPPCLLVTAAAAASHATWAALFAHRLALPVPYVHVPRLLASRAADAAVAPITPLAAPAIKAGASSWRESGPLRAAGVEDMLEAGTGTQSEAETGQAVGMGIATDGQAIPGMIQVIVQTRDAPEMLEACIDRLRATAHRPELLDIVIVDNRSVLPRTAALLVGWALQGIVRTIAHDEPFNWARANNLAVATPARQWGDAPYLLFLNNDVEMTSVGWDSALRAGLDLDGVGAMGALLLYPDGLIQHAGVIFGMGDGGPLHEGIGQLPATGPVDRWRHPRLASAVTGAWLAVTRMLFNTVGGYEEQLPIGYNDIDFCLRIRAAGQGIMQASHIVAVHRESATRGIAMSPAARAQDEADWAWMRRRWGAALDLDPAYNPHWLHTGQPFDGLATPSNAVVSRWAAASVRSMPWSVTTVPKASR